MLVSVCIASSNVSVAEAAVLAAVIKQPVPSDTHPGYDPQVNEQGAKERWNYVLDGMAENGWLPPGTDRATLQYPTVAKWDDKQTGQKRSKHKLVVDNLQLLDARLQVHQLDGAD